MKHARQTDLLIKKQNQIDNYDYLKELFLDRFISVEKYLDKNYIVPFWLGIHESICKKFLPYPDFNFLSDRDIASTMYSTNVSWAEDHLSKIENIYDEFTLQRILEEDLIGDPMIVNERFLASCNNIHHVYHLRKFLRSEFFFKDIVEWGGGYGHLPVLFDRFFESEFTYTIIDIPILCCIQWLYLSCIFGEDKINLLDNKDSDIIKNKINLVPIGLINDIQFREHDLFIAMWSLSESSKSCYDFIMDSNFFSAKHGILGFHGNESEDIPVGNMLYSHFKDNKNIEDFGYVERHYYGWW